VGTITYRWEYSVLPDTTLNMYQLFAFAMQWGEMDAKYAVRNWD